MRESDVDLRKGTAQGRTIMEASVHDPKDHCPGGEKQNILFDRKVKGRIKESAGNTATTIS